MRDLGVHHTVSERKDAFWNRPRASVIIAWINVLQVICIIIQISGTLCELNPWLTLIWSVFLQTGGSVLFIIPLLVKELRAMWHERQALRHQLWCHRSTAGCDVSSLFQATRLRGESRENSVEAGAKSHHFNSVASVGISQSLMCNGLIHSRRV